MVVTNDLLEYKHTDDTEALYMKENPLHTRLWLLCTFLSSPVYDWTDTWEHGIHLLKLILGTLSNDDDEGSENVPKKMNLRSFKLNRVYLDPLNMLNAGAFSWS